MNNVLKAYGYIRISTDNQDFERQKVLIRDHCKKYNYDLIDIIGQQVSGKKEDTESINSLKSLTKNDCDIVVATEISRLSRADKISYTINLLSGLIEEKQINVVFTDNPEKIYDTRLDEYELVQIIFEASGAAKEREKITYRMKTGMDAKYLLDSNAFRGSITPFGFKVIHNNKYNDENGKQYSKKLLVPDETKTPIVELIFNSVINGTTLNDIAKQLNERGYITNKGKKFNASSIGIIIKNELYNGKMKRNINIYDLPFKIIDDQRFKLANIRLTENQLFKTKGNKNFNQLKGILVCPCGKNMMLKRNFDYYVYTCVTKANKERHIGKCSNKGIDGDLLSETVWKVISFSLSEQGYMENNDRRIKEINETIDLNNSKISSLENDISELKKQNENLTNRIANLNTESESLLSGLIKVYDERESSIKEKEQYMVRIQNENQKFDSEINKILKSSKEQFFSNIDPQERGKIFKTYLKYVSYYDVTQYKGFIHIIFKNGYARLVAIKKYPNPYYSLLPDSFKFNIENRSITYSYLDKKPECGKGFDFSFKKSELSFEKMEELFSELTTLWKLDITLPERSKIKKVRAENNLKEKIRNREKRNGYKSNFP